jgi:hypothetical protein
MVNKQVSATVVNVVELREASGRWRESGVITDGAIVAKVTMAVAIPPAAMLTDDVELQLASEGKPEHTGAIATIPLLVKSFCDVNVRVVNPDCPGDEIVTVVGFAVME